MANRLVMRSTTSSGQCCTEDVIPECLLIVTVVPDVADAFAALIIIF